jgi:hypothetical protein
VSMQGLPSLLPACFEAVEVISLAGGQGTGYSSLALFNYRPKNEDGECNNAKGKDYDGSNFSDDDMTCP